MQMALHVALWTMPANFYPPMHQVVLQVNHQQHLQVIVQEVLISLEVLTALRQHAVRMFQVTPATMIEQSMQVASFVPPVNTLYTFLLHLRQRDLLQAGQPVGANLRLQRVLLAVRVVRRRRNDDRRPR
uniref:Secreted protein n=1 Tax=Ditylenchus dipsaci TaxID=166011 RepID=A0A915D2Y4_9BILA